MKITYSPTADAMYICFNDNIVASTQHVKDGVMVDMDSDGQLIGIELLDASQVVTNMDDIQFETLTTAQKPKPQAIRKKRAEIQAARRKKDKA